MRFTSLVLAALVAASLGTGCATTTKIATEPPGATVALEKDKKALGKTPLTYESKMWIWESEKLTVTAPGKKPKTVEVKRSEVDLLPMVGGVCLTLTGCGCVAGIPIILAGGLKFPETTKVTLDNDPGTGTPPPAALLEEPAAAAKTDTVASVRY